MRRMLFICHRIPYPPTKGDKIRAYNILKYFSARFEVYLGCLLDDPDDRRYVSEVALLCKAVHVAEINPRQAKLLSLRGFLTGDALSVAYFQNRGLHAWIKEIMTTIKPEALFAFSSNIAPYVLPYTKRQTISVCDLVDSDSEKWRQYAEVSNFPMSAVYIREWRKISALEDEICRSFNWCTLVSKAEIGILTGSKKLVRSNIRAIPNGVDHIFFDPEIEFKNPFKPDRINFVFTGSMDYSPNIQAVEWFVAEVLPVIRKIAPDAEFHIVGANPTETVRVLGRNPGVSVTGRVADVRPFLAYATASVAPLRIARGIQNKVLEAMAMARPAVVTSAALAGLDVEPGLELFVSDDPESFAQACLDTATQKGQEVGRAGRRAVLERYDWQEHLSLLNVLFDLPVESVRIS